MTEAAATGAAAAASAEEVAAAAAAVAAQGEVVKALKAAGGTNADADVQAAVAALKVLKGALAGLEGV